ncbi:LADA_0H00210g1_1 [Lachancea dasiensis]|uniref:LADA_0H00210g1_1 n=1 Tax=Lachancea dasiensis TaxID=1072105 RepID=A0A1G4JYM9_9SACH|nr:LADA_0H00210g1_1 [Lachancea dasiensis]
MKSTKASFKVALTSGRSKVHKSSKKMRNKVGNKMDVGVNLYMTYAGPKSIPGTPHIISNLVEITDQRAPTKHNCHKSRSCSEHNPSKHSNLKNKRSKVTKKKLNPFIGFRSYYANCVKGKIKQQELSVLLSNYWSTNYHIHKTWEFFTQHYNKHDTGMCFTDWLKKNYESETEQQLENTQKASVNGEPFIEDIYSNTDELLKRFTSRELIDMTNLHIEYQDLLNCSISLEDSSLDNSTSALTAGIRQNSDAIFF